MSETPDRIVLPRSGLVLPRVTLHESGRADYGDEDAAWMSVDVDGWSYATFIGNDVDGELPRDDMIRLLDTRVLSLRSALLAGSEEKVAQAVRRDHSTRTRWWNAVDADVQDEIVRETARAVLAALRGEESK